MSDSSSVSGSWERVFDLFHEALEWPSDERVARLRERCGDDAKLLREVTGLLAAHAGEDALLDRPLITNGEGDDGGVDAVPELAAGTVLAERFEIVRSLGSGGMAAVYEARDRELGIRVALKVLRAEIAADPDALSRFRKEIALAREITHPNVCRVYDLFFHQREDGASLQFVTMELLGGETLADRLRRDGPLSPGDLLPIAEQIVAALDAAHSVGVVHRDLKPANVMLVPASQSRPARTVVADFGLAVSFGDEGRSRVTRVGQLIGTPAYMAPEQLTGDEVTPATDVYALGLLLYEALTGSLPFADKTPFSGALRRLATPAPALRSRLPELPPVWAEAVDGCLRRDPGDRFASAREVAAALRGALPRRRPGATNRRLVAVALAVLAVLAVTAVVWWSGRWRTEGRDSSGQAAATGSPAQFESSWVLIGDFENRTGEKVFDGTLEYALGRELSNSRFVQVVPRQRTEDSLRLMEKPLTTVVDRKVGQEVCLRDGGIRALITGRVEKLASTYVLSAELVNPADGATVASFSEEAAGQDRVAPAVRTLADRVRGALGERLESIQDPSRGLARVTTPSLRALHLFTQADAVIARSSEGDATAEQLLREAVAEDPEFASGYMHLAYALANQRRPREEFLPYAKRAFELSNRSSERERYFIQGGYFSLAGEDQKAIAAFRALLQLYPDDYWGNGNLGTLLQRTGQPREAARYWVKMADLRPYDFGRNLNAARVLQLSDTEAAQRYVDRARRAIGSADKVERDATGEAWVELAPFSERWRRGDLPEALADLDRLSAERLAHLDQGPHDEYAWQLAGAYLTLGRLQTAEGLFRSISGRGERTQGLAMVALLRGDARSIAEQLRGAQDSYFSVMLVASAGFPDEAESLLLTPEEMAASRDPHKDALREAALGHLALARGRSSEAVERLGRAVPNLRVMLSGHYFLAADTLARAYEAEGRSDAALDLLERVSRDRAHILDSYPGTYWIRLEAHRAELLALEGRMGEAAQVIAQLRGLLALADPDVALLVPLAELEKRLAASGLSASNL